MIKKIIVSVCVFISFVSFAQQGTASPYSFYGLGEERFKGTLESRSMGGVVVEQDSIHLNLTNPASFAGLKMTTLTLGGTYSATKLKTSEESANATRFGFDYLAVGLPMGKFGVAFGLMPYSSVGYKIQSVSNTANETSRKFDGSGGLNKVFFGLGYEIKSGFSVGADLHYNFGKIETSSLEFVTGVPVGTREANMTNLTGININLGAMYQAKVNSKNTFYSSINYTLPTKVRADNVRKIATTLYSSDFSSENVDVLDDIESKSEIKMASKLSLGIGYGQSKKWMIGTQLIFQGANDLNPNQSSNLNASTEAYSKYAIGGYFIPNYNSFTSYAKRIVYRGGLKFEKTGLIVNSESIKDMGVSIGAGFPITGQFSNVNIGLEFGKKGTTSSNLVQENYFNASLSFSLNDKWFRKSKID